MINPFKKDPAIAELKAQREAHELDIASSHSEPGYQEQWAEDIMKEKSELTKWQQDMYEELAEMEHSLRNEILNREGEWVPNKDFLPDGKIINAKPMCSEECIQRLKALLRPSLSKNLMMSKYEKESILRALLDLMNEVTLLLIANRKKYNIKMSDLSPIVEIFKTAATPTYYRALGGNEKTYLSSIRKDTYLHTRGEEDGKKKGLFA